MLEQETIFTRTFLKGFRPYIWLLVLIFTVYGQTLGFGFTNYDDDQLILNNQAFIKDLSHAGQAFRQDVLSNPKGLFYYRPLLTISFMVDAQMGGTGPFVYHLTNLLIHLLGCWLLFAVFLKLTGQRDSSFAAALLFTVHPVLSQAVAWIPGRNDSLLAVYLLGALAAFIKHWEGGKRFWFIVTQLLFLAALFTKETAMIFPLICLAYVYLLSKPGLRTRQALIFSVIGWVLGYLLWYSLREHAITLSNAWRGFKLFTAAEAAKGLLSYTGKLGLPFNLSVLPDIRNLSWYNGTAVTILSTVSMIWLGLKNKRLAAFGLIWAVLFIVPVLTVVPGPKTFLEHRMYLPLMGILVILMALDLKKIPGLISRGLLILILVLFSACSIAHSRSFKNDMAFWRNAAVTSPDSDIARNGLGKAYYQRGQLAAAGQQFFLALEKEPENPVYLYNAAVLYLSRDNVDSADLFITKEISLYPEYPKANFIKAQICQARGDHQEAERHYLKEIGINSRYLKSYLGLAQLYLGQNRNEQARDIVLKGLQQGPQDRELRRMLTVIQ